jgi:triacylglycerol lipase
MVENRVTIELPLQITISLGAPTPAPGTFEQTLSPAQVEGVETEGVPTPEFELTRSISGYIPLLNASYKLAAQEPFQMPPGYTRLGDVRVGSQEGLDSVEATLTPEQRRAVEKDREALAMGANAGQTESIADPGAFGFVVREDSSRAILISIRGTQTPAEWLADFVPVPVPFFESPGMGLVHVGFAIFYHKIRGTIQSVLDTVDPATRITVIGHSLGGAMAILCAADIERNMQKKNVDVCTFGGPRTGKIDFRIRFNHEVPTSYRVVNALDIVPHVPSVITGWNHVGREIDVNGKGPSPHSLEAYLDGLTKLARPTVIEGASFRGVLSMQVL